MQNNSLEVNKRKAAGGQRQAANQSKQPKHSDSNAAAQRERLLKALRKGSLTTLSARRDLDILHPAARVQELRDQGHGIVTHWQTDITESGYEHRVARYVLVREAAHVG